MGWGWGALGKKLLRGFQGSGVLFWVPPGYSCPVLEVQKPLPADACSLSHIPSSCWAKIDEEKAFLV